MSTILLPFLLADRVNRALHNWWSTRSKNTMSRFCFAGCKCKLVLAANLRSGETWATSLTWRPYTQGHWKATDDAFIAIASAA